MTHSYSVGAIPIYKRLRLQDVRMNDALNLAVAVSNGKPTPDSIVAFKLRKLTRKTMSLRNNHAK
jgi:hypothetical protein